MEFQCDKMSHWKSARRPPLSQKVTWISFTYVSVLCPHLRLDKILIVVILIVNFLVSGIIKPSLLR